MIDINQQIFRNQEKIYTYFSDDLDTETKYKRIIEFGSFLHPFPPEDKIELNLVQGCQSIVYLSCKKIDNKLFFYAFSEALISSGLAALAVTFYSGLTAEEVLKTSPHFIQKLQLCGSLTPGRSNGLASMINIIKKHAVNFLIAK
jgi:cysteine desulfuration protein SufE